MHALQTLRAPPARGGGMEGGSAQRETSPRVFCFVRWGGGDGQPVLPAGTGRDQMGKGCAAVGPGAVQL